MFSITIHKFYSERKKFLISFIDNYIHVYNEGQKKFCLPPMKIIADISFQQMLSNENNNKYIPYAKLESQIQDAINTFIIDNTSMMGMRFISRNEIIESYWDESHNIVYLSNSDSINANSIYTDFINAGLINQDIYIVHAASNQNNLLFISIFNSDVMFVTLWDSRRAYYYGTNHYIRRDTEKYPVNMSSLQYISTQIDKEDRGWCLAKLIVYIL